MIKQLKIRGYKSLKELDLELGPLTALIGPNAGGKTNLLDFFAFLSEAVNEKMQKAVPDRGGFQSLVFAGGADRISWDLEFGPVGTLAFEESGIRYKVELKGIRHMHTIESEELTKDSMPLVTARKGKATFRRMSHQALKNLDTTPEMDLMDSELSIAQVRDPQAYPTLDRVRTYIASWTTYGNFDTSINAPIRQAQFAGPDNRLLPDGSNLTTVLYHLRNHSEYRTEYSEILETLRVAYPHFEELNFPAESQGKIILHWKSKHFKRSFSSTFLSDGTLRFLCLVTILLSPDPPPLICIDEPELGLHPSLLHLIADLLKNAAVRTQLVVATHSPQLVSCIDAKQVAVVESEQVATTIKRLADRPELEKWLKDFSLGELWTMGELGGRP
ncbi:MAG: AAA family ATPase [Nitrospirae bacterium]|nr:AAA family ATPase [Nitrospirota bacterium]